MRRTRQNGFAIVELLLVLVIVGIIAFVTWRVIEAVGDADTAANQVTDNSVPPSSDVPEAKTTDDLDNLKQQLDSTDLEDQTSSQLNTETTF